MIRELVLKEVGRVVCIVGEAQVVRVRVWIMTNHLQMNDTMPHWVFGHPPLFGHLKYLTHFFYSITTKLSIHTLCYIWSYLYMFGFQFCVNLSPC